MPAEELKKCPFCGFVPIKKHHDGNTGGFSYYPWYECSKCRARPSSGNLITKDSDAIDLWNRRADTAEGDRQQPTTAAAVNG